MKEFDDSYMVMHLAQVQRLVFGADATQVTAIQIQLQRTAQMPLAKARLAELLNRARPPWSYWSLLS